jgi:uncharacterized coiled-coil protein SlyX
MPNRILRRLAIAAGTGLAVGVNVSRPRPYREDLTPAPIPVVPDLVKPSAIGDDFLNLNIDPLLDRLEAIEGQIEAFGKQADRPNVLDEYAARLAALERRAEDNARALGALRESVNSAERSIALRTDDLRESLRTGLLTHTNHVEKSLAEQTDLIATLGSRVTEAENTLQRLATALEKLCERAQALIPSHEPASHSPQSEVRLPFEAQLDDALKRDPVTPVLRTKEPVEAASPPKKPRLFSSAWWSPD